MTKINLDRDIIDHCRELAESVAHPVLIYINRHSTVSIERSVLRLLGFQGAHEVEKGMPYPVCNLIVDKLGQDKLKMGVASVIASIKNRYPRWNQAKMAEKIIKGEVNFERLEILPPDKAQALLKPWIDTAVRHIDKMRYRKEDMRHKLGRGKKMGPLKYIIVATGNIYEDVKHAQSAAKQGADIIAVIRSTAQSLLDYVPHGATTEGFGGTFATQENFKIMREALDETSEELGRYIRLCNYSSGLCMSEIAVMGAEEGLDYLLNDAMYGILFRDINMKRTLIDQHFSRMVIARAGIGIQTGEDNYLTTADAFHNHHQVLASQFLNENLAKHAGLRDEQIGLGHAFEVDPMVEDSFLIELAMAQMVREIFPRCPIKYMPPTRHKQGDIFFSHVMDAMFNMVGSMTGQSIQLLGMATEANHNPYLQDRFWALKSANYIFSACRSLYDDVQFVPNGKVMRQARQVLDRTHRFLRKIDQQGLFESIEHGMFAEMPRAKDGGKGHDGIFEKARQYFNPFYDLFQGQGRR
ncbi:MAG: D-lysine 5,6-aminomutase subunit alpha [Deltaproteobacteria bacterium]|nr:D-lysine 5,6-aminomutase subunit alpha [Deltaproteobacteria bacterium]